MILRKVIVLLVIAFAVVVVVGGGSPIRPAYVNSGSMTPTIEQGDAFLVVTVREPAPNDIITYYSEERGRLVTHRVVDVTDAGYITKGDASDTTDQAVGYPPVPTEQVVGIVPQIWGLPLVVPGGAAILTTIESNRLLIALGLAVFALASEYRVQRNHRRRARTRSVVFANQFVRLFIAAFLIIGLAAIFLGTSTHSLTYVATTVQTGAGHTVVVGESTVQTITVDTHTPLLTTTIVEANGVTILDRSITPSGIDLRVRVPPQSDTGVYRAQVQVYPYPATLPHGILYRLHEIHWLLAGLGSIGVILAPLLVACFILLDSQKPFRSTRVRWLHQLGGK